MCGKVAEDIREDRFEPETIVALAKGGWFAGRILSGLLGLKELISLGVEHYSGISEKEIKVEKIMDSLNGKEVLIVDDIANTGKSIKTAFEQVKDAGGKPKTAVLQLMYTSEFTPDYFGEYITEDAWMIFLWNFFEDMIDIIRKLMEKERRELSEWDIKQALYREHQIEPIYLEIAQPRKLVEVMNEMERRNIVKRNVSGRKITWRINESGNWFNRWNWCL